MKIVMAIIKPFKLEEVGNSADLARHLILRVLAVPA